MTSSVEKLRDALLARGWTISTAESCTGGLCAAALVDLPGSSTWYSGGVVAYSNAIKHELLDVPKGVLEDHGAVSEPVALAMSEGVRSRCRSSVSCSTTGIAGPGGGTPDKPVGLVWIGIATPTGTHARRYHFSGDRMSVRQQTVDACFELLSEQIES
jgi:nicotinamide-nucleotide amidase